MYIRMKRIFIIIIIIFLLNSLYYGLLEISRMRFNEKSCLNKTQHFFSMFYSG